MIVNSKYDNIILPSTSTPSNIQNRVGAGFPLDWHVKEACNCQSWMLSYSLMMMSSNSKNLTARIIGSNYISRSCLFPIWEEESLMGWDGWRLLWFLSDQKQSFSYNISIFLSLLGSLKMKKKLSEEALCPFHIPLHEQSISNLIICLQRIKNLLAQGISLYSCQVDTIFPSLFYGLDYEVCQTLSASFVQRNVVEGQ